MLTVQIFELADVWPWLKPWGGASRAALVAGVIGLTIAAIIRPLALQTWSSRETIEWIAGLWIGGVLLWWLLIRHAAQSAGFCSAWAIAMLVSLGAVVLAMSGSQTYGQLAGALPAVWVPMAVLATFSRTRIFTKQTPAMLVLLYGGLLLCGQLYAELTAANALLLALAPLGLCVGDLPPVRRSASLAARFAATRCRANPSCNRHGLSLDEIHPRCDRTRAVRLLTAC